MAASFHFNFIIIFVVGGTGVVAGVLGGSVLVVMSVIFVAIAGLAAIGVDCSRRLFDGGFLGTIRVRRAQRNY